MKYLDWCLILLQKTRKRTTSSSEPIEEDRMLKLWQRRFRVFQSAENLTEDCPSPDPKHPSEVTQGWMSQTVLPNWGAGSVPPDDEPLDRPIRQLCRPMKSKVKQTDRQTDRQTHQRHSAI